MKTYIYYLKSPIGVIRITANENHILSVSFSKNMNKNKNNRKYPSHVRLCVKQLKEYLTGKRKDFNLPIKIEGTTFQKKVWCALEKIPHGSTTTYGLIAKTIGNPNAFRAVGGACNKNKFLILVPCHRVVGASKKIGGFRPGVMLKKWLLNHESTAFNCIRKFKIENPGQI